MPLGISKTTKAYPLAWKYTFSYRLRSNVISSVSIAVVFGMGSWWRSCSWPAFLTNLLFEASGFSAVAAHIPSFLVT